jgi:hypothetical protein
MVVSSISELSSQDDISPLFDPVRNTLNNNFLSR